LQAHRLRTARRERGHNGNQNYYSKLRCNQWTVQGGIYRVVCPHTLYRIALRDPSLPFDATKHGEGGRHLIRLYGYPAEEVM